MSARCLRRATIWLLTPLLAACGGALPLLERLEADTAHERYAHRLRDAGLDGTALGGGWLAAADSAVAQPTPLDLPARVTAYFAGTEARAVAWAVHVRAGQELTATVAWQGDSAAGFADLFEAARDTLDAPRGVASTDSTTSELTTVARRDGVYVLRVQPELLRAARVEVTLRVAGSLAVFPVAGRSTSAIRSGFGAERDGGVRDHHGVDIFAARGTPAIAATDGYVRSTTPSRLGGNLVWLRDDGARQSLYYAHLDTVLVAAGARVRAGDTLGLVGNTGNARTTPPHLHFGIYARGPVDPYPFVYQPREEPPSLQAPLDPLGTLRRASGRETLRLTPGARAGDRASVAGGTPFRVLAAASASYFVALPDGRAGWIDAARTRSLDAPLRTTRLEPGTLVRDRPVPSAVVVDSLASARTLPVLGEFGAYRLVRDGDRLGWVGDRAP